MALQTWEESELAGFIQLEHTHVVNSFESFLDPGQPEGVQIESNTFGAGPYSWKIVCRPSDHASGSPHHGIRESFGLYVVLVSAPGKQETLPNTHYSVALLNQLDPRGHIERGCHTCFKVAEGRGFPQVVTLQRLLARRSEFIVGGALRVRAQLQVPLPEHHIPTAPTWHRSKVSGVPCTLSSGGTSGELTSKPVTPAPPGSPSSHTTCDSYLSITSTGARVVVSQPMSQHVTTQHAAAAADFNAECRKCMHHMLRHPPEGFSCNVGCNAGRAAVEVDIGVALLSRLPILADIAAETAASEEEEVEEHLKSRRGRPHQAPGGGMAPCSMHQAHECNGHVKAGACEEAGDRGEHVAVPEPCKHSVDLGSFRASEKMVPCGLGDACGDAEQQVRACWGASEDAHLPRSPHGSRTCTQAHSTAFSGPCEVKAERRAPFKPPSSVWGLVAVLMLLGRCMCVSDLLEDSEEACATTLPAQALTMASFLGCEKVQEDIVCLLQQLARASLSLPLLPGASEPRSGSTLSALEVSQVLHAVPQQFCEAVAAGVFQGEDTAATVAHALRLPRPLLQGWLQSQVPRLDLRATPLSAAQSTKLLSHISHVRGYKVLHLFGDSVGIHSSSPLRVTGSRAHDSEARGVPGGHSHGARDLRQREAAHSNRVSTGSISMPMKQAVVPDCGGHPVLEALELAAPTLTQLRVLGLHGFRMLPENFVQLGRVLMHLAGSLIALTVELDTPVTLVASTRGHNHMRGQPSNDSACQIPQLSSAEKQDFFKVLAVARALQVLALPQWKGLVGREYECVAPLCRLKALEVVLVDEVPECSVQGLVFKKLPCRC